MKRRKLLELAIILVIILGPLAAVVAFFASRYADRPFFGNHFMLLGWRIGGPMGIRNDSGFLGGYIDWPEGVMLVVEGDGATWAPRYMPVGDWLTVYRVQDGRGKSDITREIEWRRDCLICVDREGVPTYTSISPRELRDAFDAFGMEAMERFVLSHKPAPSADEAP